MGIYSLMDEGACYWLHYDYVRSGTLVEKKEKHGQFSLLCDPFPYH
jgi:hypothetical protein